MKITFKVAFEHDKVVASKDVSLDVEVFDGLETAGGQAVAQLESDTMMLLDEFGERLIKGASANLQKALAEKTLQKAAQKKAPEKEAKPKQAKKAANEQAPAV